MKFPDDILKSLVFLGYEDPETGKKRFVGTAVIVVVECKIPEKQWYQLVTAKHVKVSLDGKKAFIRANLVSGGTKDFDLPSIWFDHPDDPSIDAIVNAWIPPDEVDAMRIPIEMFLTEKLSTEGKLGMGDEVFITGLFSGIKSENKNLPIVRTGTIALMPNGKVIPTKHFGNIEGYLIEARSLGGLSGSPVFLYENSIFKWKLHFMGIIHGHLKFDETENEYLGIFADGVGKINSGIAIVIPAYQILEIINQPLVVETRKQIEIYYEKTGVIELDTAKLNSIQ